jgi:hypothetical protein
MVVSSPAQALTKPMSTSTPQRRRGSSPIASRLLSSPRGSVECCLDISSSLTAASHGSSTCGAVVGRSVPSSRGRRCWLLGEGTSGVSWRCAPTRAKSAGIVFPPDPRPAHPFPWPHSFISLGSCSRWSRGGGRGWMDVLGEGPPARNARGTGGGFGPLEGAWLHAVNSLHLKIGEF